MKTMTPLTAMKAMKAVQIAQTMKTIAKAMKAIKVVKAGTQQTKVAKAMKVSKVATGKLAKRRVFRGASIMTGGGLKKVDLMRNKTGKIVSKMASAVAMKKYATTIGKWILACTKAREVLGVQGFVAVKKGSPVYKKARELYKR